MKLEFDSISEMEQFLMFSAHIGRAFAVDPSIMNIPAASGAGLDLVATMNERAAEQESIAERERQDANNEAFVAATNDAPASTDKPKRTRRTKAEIEAERAAAERVAEETAIMNNPIDQAMTPPAGANPFAVASPATQAILDAPNQSAATLAGIAAIQTPPGHEEAEQPVEPRVIESIEHLRACQSFIQAHGMAKYNESFKDGLNANIAAYTPEQRAQHVAILSTLTA